jgi:hypothetical protein
VIAQHLDKRADPELDDVMFYAINSMNKGADKMTSASSAEDAQSNQLGRVYIPAHLEIQSY